MIVRLAMKYEAQKGSGATLASTDGRIILTTTKYNSDTGTSDGTEEQAISLSRITAKKVDLQTQLDAVTLLETDCKAL